MKEGREQMGHPGNMFVFSWSFPPSVDTLTLVLLPLGRSLFQLLSSMVDDYVRLHFEVELDTVDCTIGKMMGLVKSDDTSRSSDIHE